MEIEIRTVTLDGKKLAYTSETLFLVQVGKNRGAYRTRYRFVGDIHAAAKHYRAINVAYGYKKRLLLRSNKYQRPLAKQIT